MQSIIVSAPALGLGSGQTWQNVEGVPMTVQVIFGRSLCMFKTTLMRYAALPSGASCPSKCATALSSTKRWKNRCC